MAKNEVERVYTGDLVVKAVEPTSLYCYRCQHSASVLIRVWLTNMSRADVICAQCLRDVT